MLTIKIDGKNVVLKSDFSFEVSRENPIFNDPEELAGDYIESMTFPMTGNRQVFKNSNRISSSIRGVDYKIEIFYNGYRLAGGTFTIKSAGADYITGDAKLNALSFFNLIKDLKLTDIPETEKFHMGENQDLVKVWITIISNGQPEADKFPFVFPPMTNEDFYDDSETFEYNGIVNQCNPGTPPRHVFSSIDSETSAVTIIPFVPCFYLDYLFKTTVKAQQYTVKLPALPLLNKLIMATNNSIDIKNNISVTKSEADTGWINRNTWMSFKHNITQEDPEIPYIYSFFNVKKTGYYKIKFDLRGYLNSEVYYKYQDKIRIYSEFIGPNAVVFEIQNNEIIHLEEGFLFVFQGIARFGLPYDKIQIKGNINIESIINSYLLYNNTVHVNRHVPNIEQIKLFSIIKGIFNAGFFINDARREIETVTFNEIMTKKPLPLDIKISGDRSIDKQPKGVEVKYENSWTEDEKPDEIAYTGLTYSGIPEIAGQGEYARVINEGNIYFYNEDEEDWELFEIDNMEHKIEEDDMVSFNIPFSLFSMNQNENNYLMPKMEGKGISVFNKKHDGNEFTILVYHGKQIVADSGDNNLLPGPLASIAKYDGNGAIIDFNHSLLPDDVVKNYHRQFIHFIRTSREVKFKTKMRIVDFMKLRLQEKYTADGYTFIIKNMKMTVKEMDYSLADMTIAVI